MSDHGGQRCGRFIFKSDLQPGTRISLPAALEDSVHLAANAELEAK